MIKNFGVGDLFEQVAHAVEQAEASGVMLDWNEPASPGREGEPCE